MAEGALFTARRAEQQSLRAYEWPVIASWMRRPRQARWRCSAGARPARVVAARAPDEVQWARDLMERIEERKADTTGLGRDGHGIERGDRNASRVARAGRSDSRPAKPQEQAETTTHGLDPATEAILRRSSRTSPSPRPPRPPEREGPSLLGPRAPAVAERLTAAMQSHSSRPLGDPSDPYRRVTGCRGRRICRRAHCRTRGTRPWDGAVDEQFDELGEPRNLGSTGSRRGRR